MMVDARERLRLGDYLTLAFWPLWALVLVLQLLDVGSVGLAALHGSQVVELNPVILALAARYGVVGAMLVKCSAAMAWLGLALGVWTLAERYRWRLAQGLCTALLLVVAVWSGWVFWDTLAAVFWR